MLVEIDKVVCDFFGVELESSRRPSTVCITGGHDFLITQHSHPAAEDRILYFYPKFYFFGNFFPALFHFGRGRGWKQCRHALYIIISMGKANVLNKFNVRGMIERHCIRRLNEKTREGGWIQWRRLANKEKNVKKSSLLFELRHHLSTLSGWLKWVKKIT